MPVPGAYRAALEFKQSFEGILHLGLRYFLDTLGETNPVYRDAATAKAEGFAAPPIPPTSAPTPATPSTRPGCGGR